MNRFSPVELNEVAVVDIAQPRMLRLAARANTFFDSPRDE